MRRSTFIYSNDQAKENLKWEWAARNFEAVQNEALTKTDMRFEEFAKDFYKADSAYLQVRTDTGIHYKRSSLDYKQGNLDNHVMPYFKAMKLSDIGVDEIDNWLSVLAQKASNNNKNTLSESTRKHCTEVLNNVMAEAVRKGIIKTNPVEHALKIKRLFAESCG